MTGSSEQLRGRRIVVTGAASGMGEGVARRFTAEGARLFLLDVQAERLEAIATETGQAFGTCDVGDEAQVRQSIAAAAEALGGIDGLVNVAGILTYKTAEASTFEEFQRLISVNLAGPFLTSTAALPHLRASGRATIVNVASLAGVRPQPGMAVYSATKAGLIALSEAMSGEVGPEVRVNVICPGIIRTPMTQFMWERDGGADPAASIPVGRVGTPEDIAGAALFLTCHDAGFINGEVMTVTGGHFR
jgi:NAD(P)-dependent dehydrogenase (short-subunit alcohol dehydrogenase family)